MNKPPFIIYSSSRLPEHVTEALERGGRGATNDQAELFELVIKELSRRKEVAC